MVIHIEKETENKFREFLKRKGYEYGDLKKESTKAIEQYMTTKEGTASIPRQESAGCNV
ncbi:MAG: hypothetical protein Q8J68_00490 [Methanolobus sp.]|uniref:hypothetical protein n=1 Tax=Methanolobus sp. TaxID=1874737 RepID=UPI00272F1195|nr:hypothetical protein [Methanolobus sp.]MDP2215760.1 hypothetical protein [Methanolobus sp.]